jgi:hypothetical protein
MGTPDSPMPATSVARWIRLPLWCTGQSSGTPDSPMRLTSLTDYDLLTSLTAVAADRCSWTHQTVRCTPDNLVNFSRGALRFPESV